MKTNFKTVLVVLACTFIPTLLIWLPFFLRMPSFWSIPLPKNGLETIVANYDGPLYMVVAKSFYNKEFISANFQFPLPSEYYSAHFPLFPILIKIFGTVTNYPYAMLIATLLTSALAIYFFYKLISEYADKNNSMFLTFLFAIFPARWLVVRSVGSADPLFVGAIIASLYYFKKAGSDTKNYWAAALWGAIAQITKSPGILLFISYSIYFILPLLGVKTTNLKILNVLKKAYPLLLIPISLVAVFLLYFYVQGDFWAYFKSGDNIHLFFPPFQIFNFSAPWVGTFWLEEVIFIYLIGAIGVYRLFNKKEFEMAIFSGLFFVLTLFIAHRDLMRYTLPLVPFLYVAFSDILTKKEFKLASILIVIPIYLFSLAFISQNVMPIANWAPFL